MSETAWVIDDIKRERERQKYLKLYAVALDEAMQTVEKATRSLGAAWQAIAQLEQQK